MSTQTITGCICVFGRSSTHAMQTGADGKQTDVGTIALFRDDKIISRLAGIPLLAPDSQPREIGTITRAWADGEFLLIEGEITDTPGARYWLTQACCGLCPLFRIPQGVPAGRTELSPDDFSIDAVRITRTGQSGFAESWVKFKDSAIRYETQQYVNPLLSKF
jgi:hypothetical protein